MEKAKGSILIKNGTLISMAQKENIIEENKDILIESRKDSKDRQKY
jgi:hypothetical protein